MSSEIIKKHIYDVLQNIRLDTKVETYWDYRDAEWQEIVWYRDPVRLEWTDKKSAIRSIIQKELRQFIDEVMDENKDFIEFFL
jgi:hypothetical protein